MTEHRYIEPELIAMGCGPEGINGIISVVRIDACLYVIWQAGTKVICHAGNCDNPIHKVHPL